MVEDATVFTVANQNGDPSLQYVCFYSNKAEMYHNGMYNYWTKQLKIYICEIKIVKYAPIERFYIYPTRKFSCKPQMSFYKLWTYRCSIILYRYHVHFARYGDKPRTYPKCDGQMDTGHTMCHAHILGRDIIMN